MQPRNSTSAVAKSAPSSVGTSAASSVGAAPLSAGTSAPSSVGNPFSLWGKSWLIWRITRRQLASVAHLARGRAVDIGCGEQPLRTVFAGRVDSTVGLDHPRMLHPDDQVGVFGTALSLPFRPDAFGTAICFQVLEHVPEPEQLLREAFRVLEPGGHLFLTAPHIWNEHEIPHDYYRYTRYGLAYLLKKVGFEVVEVRPMAGFFVTAGARFCYFLAHFDRWGLQIAVRPLYFLVQAGAMVLDRIYCDTTECWNFLAVARKPSRAAVDVGASHRTADRPEADSGPAAVARTSAGAAAGSGAAAVRHT